MKQKYKWIWFAAMLVCVALLAGCGAGQDDVSDPLAGFGVDAVVPFATKDATMAPSASPSPSASAMAPIATVTQGWQTEVVPTPVPTSETYAQLARGNSACLRPMRLAILAAPQQRRLRARQALRQMRAAPRQRHRRICAMATGARRFWPCRID